MRETQKWRWWSHDVMLAKNSVRVEYETYREGNKRSRETWKNKTLNASSHVWPSFSLSSSCLQCQPNSSRDPSFMSTEREIGIQDRLELKGVISWERQEERETRDWGKQRKGNMKDTKNMRGGKEGERKLEWESCIPWCCLTHVSTQASVEFSCRSRERGKRWRTNFFLQPVNQWWGSHSFSGPRFECVLFFSILWLNRFEPRYSFSIKRWGEWLACLPPTEVWFFESIQRSDGQRLLFETNLLPVLFALSFFDKNTDRRNKRKEREDEKTER